MKINRYEINTEPIPGICKSKSMWGYDADKNGVSPLIYFCKPKWMSPESFDMIVKSIRLDLPENFEVTGME